MDCVFFEVKTLMEALGYYEMVHNGAPMGLQWDADIFFLSQSRRYNVSS